MRSRVLAIQIPEYQLFFHGAVVVVNKTLHAVENKAFVEIGLPTPVPNLNLNAQVSLKQDGETWTLPGKAFGILQGAIRLDGHDHAGATNNPAGVSLGVGLSVDSKLYTPGWRGLSAVMLELGIESCDGKLIDDVLPRIQVLLIELLIRRKKEAAMSACLDHGKSLSEANANLSESPATTLTEEVESFGDRLARVDAWDIITRKHK